MHRAHVNSTRRKRHAYAQAAAQPIEYKALSQAAFEPFRHMTFPAHGSLLESKSPSELAIIGATGSGIEIALALTVIDSPTGRAELLSVFVDPRYRNRGVATILLDLACDELGVRGIQSVRARYMTGQPTTAALERLFAKTGWSIPQPRMRVVRFTLASLKGAPWIEGFRVLPSGYDIVPWADLRQRERAELRETQERDHWIAHDLIPFDYEVGIELVTSLALRHHGKVVGWCLTHSVEDILRFTCAYVRRDLARLGRGLLLFSEAVTRMPRIGLTAGMWTIPLHHGAFARFAERRMRPYFVFFGETRGVKKSLTA